MSLSSPKPGPCLVFIRQFVAILLFVIISFCDPLADSISASGFMSGRDEYDSPFRGRRDRSSRRRDRSSPPPQSDVFEEEGAPSQQPPDEPLQQAEPPQQAQPAQPAPRPQVRRPQAVPVRPVRPGQPQRPGQPTPPSGQSGEAPSEGIPPEGHIVLRLAPLSQLADVGEIVTVHVWLDNPKEKPFDVLSFALAYDPNLLEFVDAPGGEENQFTGFDLSEKTIDRFNFIRDVEEDPFYLNRAEPEKGFVHYRARCASGEHCTREGFVYSMKFRALAPVDRTRLRFLFSEWSTDLKPPDQSDQDWSWPDYMTFISNTAEKKRTSALPDILGSETNRRDGVISGIVTVRSQLDKEAILELEEETPKGQTGTRFYLTPAFSAVQAGKTIDLTVNLDNPERVSWDRVRLDIRYDPEYLRVVDQDEGNWITLGANILDGPFHDRFPFRWTRENNARNDIGRILYDNGVFGEPLRNGGTLATIRFFCLKPAAETRIVFNTPEDVTSRDGTILTRKRSDVLGDTEDPRDGVSGGALSIVPRKELISADVDGLAAN